MDQKIKTEKSNKIHKKYDVIIIGGGVAGLSLSVALTKKYKNKKILLIRKEEKNLVPCGIPYIFGKLKYNIDSNVKPHEKLIKLGADFLVDEVNLIDLKNKEIKTDNNGNFSYLKLVIATGSLPLIPKFIKGYDNPDIYYINKSYNYINTIIPKLKEAKKIAIVGGGFIGLEVADELASYKDKDITVIEMQKNCLSTAFSKTFCEKAENALKNKGITVKTNTKVVEVQHNGKPTLVFSDNTKLEVDIVIFSLGYKPNVELAVNAGLKLNRFGAIKVDSLMRTSDLDVLSLGDCAEKKDFITRKDSNAMLASVTGAESRFLAENLFEINSIKNSLGTIKIFCTSLNNESFASAGITELEAEQENISIIIGEFKGFDKHPKSLQNTNEIHVRVNVMKKTGYIVGAEIYGGPSIGEMINIIGIAIQAKLTIYDFYTFQVGTHPLLTGGPAITPLIKAVENSIEQLIEY